MKTEAKKKTRLSTVPEAALEEAGLAKETILAAIPMDGVVLVTKDSMPIVELLQMLDRLNLYAARVFYTPVIILHRLDRTAGHLYLLDKGLNIAAIQRLFANG